MLLEIRKLLLFYAVSGTITLVFIYNSLNRNNNIIH
mgnify:CR=1 FL=1